MIINLHQKIQQRQKPANSYWAGAYIRTIDDLLRAIDVYRKDTTKNLFSFENNQIHCLLGPGSTKVLAVVPANVQLTVERYKFGVDGSHLLILVAEGYGKEGSVGKGKVIIRIAE